MKMERPNNEKVRKVLIGTMSNFQSKHVSLVLVTITDVELSPFSREHSLEHCLGPVEQEAQVVIGLLNFARRKQNFG